MRVRIIFPILLAAALCAYFWETRSPAMSGEKFYRNIRVETTEPVRLSYPAAIIKAEVGEQSSFLGKCGKESCGIWIVAYENETSGGAILPGSWFRGGVPVRYFQIKVFLGSVRKSEYREVFSLMKSGSISSAGIRRAVKNPEAAKALEMYYLGIPLSIRMRPISCSIAEKHGGLVVVISGSLESADLVK